MGNKHVMWATVLALAFAAGGCASLSSNDEGREISQREVLIHVQNQNFYDVTVYMRLNGERRRLGNVVGNRTDVFTVAWVPQAVRFEVRLLAGRTYMTNYISMSPGDDVRVTIPAF